MIKKLLEQLRTGFKRIMKWNKYRPEMTNQTKNNNLKYLIDATFTKVNRLFVLSFENENERTSFSKYYVPRVQIKDFNVLIDRKSFLNMSIKNEEETYEQIIEMGRNNDYTTQFIRLWILFKILQINCNRFKQVNWIRKPWLNKQNNFIGRLERNEGVTMFFIIEKSEKTTFEFSLNVAAIV